MTLDEALLIAEKIDRRMFDHTTRDPRFAPLIDQPFLAESFLHLLRALDTDHHVDYHWDNFLNVCELMCPDFTDILASIELPLTVAHRLPYALTGAEMPLPTCKSPNCA